MTPRPQIRTWIAASVLLAASSYGCQRGERDASPAPGVSPTEPVAEGSAAESAPAEPPMPSAPPDACVRLPERLWSSAEDALLLMGVHDARDRRDRYLSALAATEFVDRCANVSSEKMDCLWRGAVLLDALPALATCRINEGLAEPIRLLPPRIDPFTRFSPAPIDEAFAREQRARFEGAWVEEGGVERWSIGDDGTGTIQQRPTSDAVPVTLSVTEPGLLQRDFNEGRRVVGGSFLFDGDDAFYATENRAFDIVRLEPGTPVVVRSWERRMLYDRNMAPPRCIVFDEFGAKMAGATCTFDEAAGELVFETAPAADLESGADAEPTRDRFVIVGEHLVHDQIQRFVRAGDDE